MRTILIFALLTSTAHAQDRYAWIGYWENAQYTLGLDRSTTALAREGYLSSQKIKVNYVLKCEVTAAECRCQVTGKATGKGVDEGGIDTPDSQIDTLDSLIGQTLRLEKAGTGIRSQLTGALSLGIPLCGGSIRLGRPDGKGGIETITCEAKSPSTPRFRISSSAGTGPDLAPVAVYFSSENDGCSFRWYVEGQAYSELRYHNYSLYEAGLELNTNDPVRYYPLIAADYAGELSYYATSILENGSELTEKLFLSRKSGVWSVAYSTSRRPQRMVLKVVSVTPGEAVLTVQFNDGSRYTLYPFASFLESVDAQGTVSKFESSD